MSNLAVHGNAKRPVDRASTEIVALRHDNDRLRGELHDAHSRIRRLEAEVIHDPLTGLLNRRGLDIELARAAGRAGRYGEVAALVYLDLDRFKSVNDGYGHDAGDRVLCEVAAILSANTRGSDIAARVGGDEFVVILLHATADFARVKADRIGTLIGHAAKRLGFVELAIGASAGVAAIGGEGGEAALIAADHDLYAERARRAAPAASADAQTKSTSHEDRL